MQLPNVRRILILCEEDVRLHLFLVDVDATGTRIRSHFRNHAAISATLCHPELVSTFGHVSLG